MACEDGRGGYTVVDGERRYEIAKNSGYRRLIVAIHPFMSDQGRETIRLELKRTSQPLSRETAESIERWLDDREVRAA